MMQNNKETAKKFTFEDIAPKLTHNQLRFVVAMQESTSKKEAAEAIGIKPATAYHWPEYVDEAVELFKEAYIEDAKAILSGNVVRAAIVKVAGMYEEDPRVRQAAATEILDRALGKPLQKSEVNETGNKTIKVIYDRSEPMDAAQDTETD